MLELTQIILATLTVSLISFSGAILLVNKKLLTPKLIPFFVSFAAGVMLTSAFLDLLPEALEEAGKDFNIFLPAFLGVILFFILERFLLWFHHHDDLHNTQPSAYLILLGDALHNLIDGIVIAASFMTDFSLGVITTLAIVAHEVPQEIADFSVLIHAGFTKIKALTYNLFSGLTAVIGAVATYYFLENLTFSLPVLLSFTAGMFIYIACSDLIPEMHIDFKSRKNWLQFLPFIAGIIILWGSIALLEG